MVIYDLEKAREGKTDIEEECSNNQDKLGLSPFSLKHMLSGSDIYS